MKIHLLTYTDPENLSSKSRPAFDLLKEAAEKRGHELEFVYVKNCQLKFNKKPQILINNKKPKINILIVRATFSGAEASVHSAVIRQFELAGVPVVNGYSAVMKAKNKVRTLQVLQQHGIQTPKSYVVRSPEFIEEMMKNIKSYPVIIKTFAGSQGIGVSIVESKRGLHSIIEFLIRDDYTAPIIVQEYVKESRGRDIRVMVIGNKIVAAMERIASRKGEFRSNFHLGGKVRVAGLSRKEKRIAILATKACGLEISGVDILRTKEGPKVIEVNANPGLEGITQATGLDVAGEIINYAVKKAKRANLKKADFNLLKPKALLE